MKENINSLKGSYEKFLKQAIRVNHAGEYGAVCIYSGQEFILSKSPSFHEITSMKEQEKKHFYYFNNEMKKNNIRPTVFLPFWHVAGVGLGIITALMGEKAAMACTSAVEEVIGEHYKEQVLRLEDSEFKESVSKFRDEELEHRDIAIEHGAEYAPCYDVLSAFIKKTCKIAIFLSKLI